MFHNNDELNFETEYHVTTIQQHAIKTFAWMGLGLLITALVAFGMVTTNMTLRLYVSYPIAPICAAWCSRCFRGTFGENESSDGTHSFCGIFHLNGSHFFHTGFCL